MDDSKGEQHRCSIQKEVSLDAPKEIESLINNINTHTEELEVKIKRLQNDGFDYCDVTELGIQKGLTEETVKDLLLGNDYDKAIFFSIDTFRKQNSEVGLSSTLS